MSPGPGAVGELAERLRGLGVEPTARELAEALWLARHVAPARVAAGEEEPLRQAYDLDDPGLPGVPRAEHEPSASPEPVPETETGSEHRTRLYPDAPSPQAGRHASPVTETPDEPPVRVRVPMATALPHALRLQRALRPLQRYRPPVRASVHRLDEQTTAERAAETGLLLPVLRPVLRRQARLRLLMDASTSTAVWDRTLGELAQICAGTGAFREVLVQYVHEGAHGELLVGPARAPARTPRTADQFRDPTGHQLTLVLSDCAGPLWRDGRMQRLLWDLAQAAPVAVVQPLPQRMWRRTHLPAVPGILRRREGLGARMEFAAQGAPAAGLPVPVLALSDAAFRAWARLLSGSTGLALPAAAGRVHADHEPTPPPAADQTPAAGELVRTFRATASHHAVQLAVCLSAVPLAIPVMQLVQRAMLPDTGPPVLAEVLLSGLLRRGSEDDWYEFRPGVRELLLHLLPKGDALLVLKHCGDYVDRHFGRRARNFPALAHAELTGADLPEGRGEEVPQAFAEVSRLVVRRYGGPVREVAGTGGRPATEPLREHQIVYAGYDRPWAAWAERVLASHGYRALLTRWHPGRRPLLDALTALRGFDLTQPPTGKIVLMLSENLLQFGIRDPDEWRDAFRRVVASSPGLFAAVVIGERLELRLRLSELLPVATTAVSVGEADAERRLLTALSLDSEAGDGPRRPVTTRFPGVRPGVWRGVPPRDEYFTGRDDLLDALPEKLRQARRAGAVCVLRGEPGSGKTAIAAEYAHRYSSEYDMVHWVPIHGDQYDRLAELTAGFSKMTETSSGPPVQDRRLIVLDSWDGFTDGSAVALLSSARRHAHVLLMSRGGQASPVPERIAQVGPFSRAESVEYLMRTLEVTAEEAEAMARSCADQPADLRRAVEGWQESVASLPGPAGIDRSVRVELEALSRRCVVSIGGSKTHPSPRGNGFFVAPGWVLTLWPVVRDHRTEVVVRTYDGRSVAGEVVRLDSEFEGPDPVLVKLRERFDHDCLWLDDHAGTDFRTVLALGATVAGSRREQWLRRGTVIGHADLLRIRGFRAPPNSMGGPVLDPDRAMVVGALWGSVDAVHGDEMLAVPLPLLGDGRLAHAVMREHDLHHLRRHLDAQSSGDACWTSIQTRLHRVAPDGFTPELRTLLYGILATLEPPSQPQDVLDLLPRRQSGALDEEILAWRDGVRLLISRGQGLADIALYAAHVWSSRIAAPEGGDDPSALRMLRMWTEDTARTLPEGTARGQATGMIEDRRAESRMKILVEFRETAGGHRWSVSRYGGPRQWPMGEGYGGHTRSDLREAVSPALDAALRLNEAFDETPQVEFSMPYALLDEPVEEWRTGTGRPDLTLGRRARVGVALEYPGLPARALDNSERLLRWAGVTNGPLMPVSVTHEPAPLGLHLMVAPMTCVPVYCGTLVGGGAGLAVLEAAGGNGYGLVLWRRDTTHEDCDRFHERAGALVSGARTAEDLLAAVHELRLRGDDPEAAWARGIAVLYDPPDRPSHIRDDD